MWPGEFDYARPATVAEALQLLADNEDAKLLAGGHSLLPAMKLRLNEAPLLIDISRIDGLSGISNNGSLSIGALCTHAEIAASTEVQASCMALATATGMVGDQQVRNWGTLGGNVAHADPASDPPTVLVAFNANINIAGAAGSRSVAATDFFMDLFTVDLEPGEIITSIEIPAHPHDGCSYVKMSHPASRYAVVGICAVLHMDGEQLQRCACRSGRCNRASHALAWRGSCAGRFLAGRCCAGCSSGCAEGGHRRRTDRRHELPGRLPPGDGRGLPQTRGEGCLRLNAAFP